MVFDVSVIICTYNGKNRLKETLLHVLGQNTALKFEIIVVDNFSSDCTNDWVIDFIKIYDRFSIIRLVEENSPGLSNARIRGIKEARSSVILFCDDDNWLSRDYLDRGFQLMDLNPNIGVIGGCGEPMFETDKPDWFDQFSHSYAVGTRGNKGGIQRRGSWVYGAGSFFRKEGLQKLYDSGWSSLLSDRKGNSLTSGGDVELCYGMQLIGYDVWFEPKLTFKHWIESRRLTWNYYLQLKKGIASSFPLLQVYEVLLSQSPSLIHFRNIVRNRFFKGIFVFLKQYILNLIDPSPERELAIKINYTIIKSYFNNRSKAIKGFKSLEKFTFH